MMAACFALLLSSCVTNEESQSVTDIRNAKAEQLKSLAALNNAEAETAKVLAAAEAAYKAAEAELKKAEAAKLAADAENEKVVAEAEAALLKAQAAYQEALAAQIEEEIEKAKLEYDALKAEYAARIAQAEQAKAEAEKAKADAIAAMELAKVTAEKELVKAQKQLAEQKQKLKEKLEQIEAENAVTIEALYAAYVEATGYYQQAVIDLNSMKSYVAGLQAGLVSSEEALAALLESYESDIEEYVNAIALAEAKIATLEEYKGVPAEEIRAALVEANANHFALSQAYLAAAEVASDLANDTKLFGTNYYQAEYGLWDTKFSVYTEARNWLSGSNPDLFDMVYGLYQTGLMATDENTGMPITTVYLDENGEEVDADAENATAWFGVGFYSVEEDGRLSKDYTMYPLFTLAPVYDVDEDGNIANYIEYENPYSTAMFPYTYKSYYNQVVSVGAVNKESFEAVAAVVNDLYENALATDGADAELVAELKALTEKVLEAAKAVEDAENAYAAAVDDVTEEYVLDMEVYSWVPTTLGKYNAALNAEASAKGAYESVNYQLEEMKTRLANLEKKETRWALEDAIEPLKAPAAETAKALKAAQDTLAVKEKALVAAQTAQKKAAADLEAKEIAERAAKKAWEAAAAVVTEAGDKATEAQKKAEKDAKDAYDKAVEATIKANTALAEAEAAVAEAETAVATAEADVETAQTAADNAAAALKEAEDALANLDANIAQLKKEIGWVEADLAPLKAAWDAAVVAVEEAEAALEAAEALVPELKAVLDAGDLQRAYEVAVKAVEVFTEENDFGSAIYNTITSTRYTPVAAAERALGQIENMSVGYAAMYEGLADVVKEFGENAVAYLAEAEKEAAEFNELTKAYAEACVAAQLADYEAGNAYAEVTALNTALSEATDPAGIAAQIATLEGEIEAAKDAIEGIEEAIEQAKAVVDNNQDVVALWESQLASVQAYVELCEAKVAAAKAEFDAAVEAAAKAE